MVSLVPAPRHSIFLSVKRYQANCICPLHGGSEPDQTVFVPEYYSSLIGSQAALSRSYPAVAGVDGVPFCARKGARGRAINLKILRDQFYRVNLYIAKNDIMHVSSAFYFFASLSLLASNASSFFLHRKRASVTDRNWLLCFEHLRTIGKI